MSERAAACPGLNALAAFLDGRLAAGDKAAVQEHIATCDVCLELVAETLLVPAPVLVARPVGTAAFGAPRSWSRSPWAAVAAAVAAVLIAALLAPGLGSLPNVGQGPKLADLADAAGLGRPVEGRLTGGFTHRPWFAPLAGGQGGAMTSSTAIHLAAGKIRGNLQADSTATRLHSYGVSQVLLRDWAQASLALAAAAREQPKNARYQSDVAALYLERVRNGERPGDLIKALAAAERARLADPRTTRGVVQPRPRARTALASRPGTSRVGRLPGPRPFVGVGRRGARAHRRTRCAGRRVGLALGRGPPSRRCRHGACRGGHSCSGHRDPHVLRSRPVAGLGGGRGCRSSRRRRARSTAHDGRRVPAAHRRHSLSRCSRGHRSRRAARSSGWSRSSRSPCGLCRGARNWRARICSARRCRS